MIFELLVDFIKIVEDEHAAVVVPCFAEKRCIFEQMFHTVLLPNKSGKKYYVVAYYL